MLFWEGVRSLHFFNEVLYKRWRSHTITDKSGWYFGRQKTSTMTFVKYFPKDTFIKPQKHSTARVIHPKKQSMNIPIHLHMSFFVKNIQLLNT